MVFPGKNPSEDREMQHGIRETVQMAPGRVGPVFPQAPMPGPSAPAADHVVPEPDSGVAAPPQVPDHADRPTDPDMACVAAVAAANLAVEGVEDVTRYGLTIPFDAARHTLGRNAVRRHREGRGRRRRPGRAGE